MTELEQRIISKLRARLGDGRLEGSVVYLDQVQKRAAERVRVGDVVIDVPWDGYIAFVDLEPRANWGHACSYWLIGADGDEVIEFAARMPPFLKAETTAFRLLQRGHRVPEWAVSGSTM